MYKGDSYEKDYWNFNSDFIINRMWTSPAKYELNNDKCLKRLQRCPNYKCDFDIAKDGQAIYAAHLLSLLKREIIPRCVAKSQLKIIEKTGSSPSINGVEQVPSEQKYCYLM